MKKYYPATGAMLLATTTLASPLHAQTQVQTPTASRTEAAEPAPSPTASSHGAEQANGLMGEIVVTANRRAESSQNVGIAISAFSGDLVQDLGITDSTQIAKFSPGVSATGAQGGFLSTFSIRGVTQNDYNPHQEAPIAAYIDDVYISSLQGQAFAVFDTERIEILKGPQGTLFGRNATGGLVHYITRKPDTDAMSGYVSAAYGRFNKVTGEAAVNLPLSQVVAIRASGIYSQRDPVLKNSTGHDQWDNDLAAARVHLLIEPSPDFSMLFSGRYGYTSTSVSAANQYLSSIAVLDAKGNTIDQRRLGAKETAQVIFAGAPTGARPVPGGDFFGYTDPDGSGRRTTDSLVGQSVTGVFDPRNPRTFSEAYGATANVEGHSGDITANLIGDYSHFRWRVGASLTGGTAFPFGFETDALGIDQLSSEFRLSGDHGSFRWVAGAYYLSVQSRNLAAYGDPTGVVFGFGGPADEAFRFNQDTTSISFFGQAEFDVTHDLTVIAGARHIRDDKRFDYTPTFDTAAFSIPAGPTFGPATNPDETPSVDNLVAWKLGLNYKAGQDVLLYASVNRGVKSGGFNAPSNPTIGVPFTFDPEVLYAYEAGIKADMFDRLMTFNASGFYYDYKSYQAFASIGTTNYLFNSKAENYGGEVQVSATPVAGINLAASAAYTHARVFDVQLAGITKDRTPAFSPEWQFSALARYEVPTSFGKVWVQLDGSYTSSYYLQLSNYSNTRQKGYPLLNARVGTGIAQARGWSLNAQVLNVADKRYMTSTFATAGDFGADIVAFNLPRTWEISLRYEF